MTVELYSARYKATYNVDVVEGAQYIRWQVEWWSPDGTPLTAPFTANGLVQNLGNGGSYVAENEQITPWVPAEPDSKATAEEMRKRLRVQ